MKKTGSWLWGGVLVALGVILGINALGLAHINIFFPGWWTLFIIVPCAVGLFTDEHKGGPTAGLVIGICLLLSCLGILPFGILWKLLLPIILIIVGVTVMVRATSNGEVADKIRRARKEQAEERHAGKKVVEAEVVEDDDDDDEDEDDDEKGNKKTGGPKYEEYWSTFGDQNVNYDGKEFTGCRVDAVFGGADIDLRKAKIKNEAIVRASSVFGGIIVYVPDDVKVEVASTSIFGGVTDKRKSKAEAKTTLYIDANCVFGGVEIR